MREIDGISPARELLIIDIDTCIDDALGWLYACTHNQDAHRRERGPGIGFRIAAKPFRAKLTRSLEDASRFCFVGRRRAVVDVETRGRLTIGATIVERAADEVAQSKSPSPSTLCASVSYSLA